MKAIKDTPEIKKLLVEEADLKEELIDLKATIEGARCQLFLKVTGLKFGDTVISGGAEYQFCAIDDPELCWIKAYKKKKDGTFGQQIINLFGNWEKK